MISDTRNAKYSSVGIPDSHYRTAIYREESDTWIIGNVYGYRLGIVILPRVISHSKSSAVQNTVTNARACWQTIV